MSGSYDDIMVCPKCGDFAIEQMKDEKGKLRCRGCGFKWDEGKIHSNVISEDIENLGLIENEKGDQEQLEDEEIDEEDVVAWDEGEFG